MTDLSIQEVFPAILSDTHYFSLNHDTKLRVNNSIFDPADPFWESDLQTQLQQKTGDSLNVR